MPDTNHPNPIFRDNAIKHLNSLTDMQEILTIIKPASWLGIILAILFLLSLLIWSTWVKVENTIPAIGIIIAEEEFQQAEYLWQENVNEYQKKVTSLKDLFLQQKTLYQKHYITINDLEKGRQDYLMAKEQLATLNKQKAMPIFKPLFNVDSATANQTMDALVFVTHTQGKKILPGMDSYILPDTVSAYEYGYLRGKVVSISEYPVSKEVVYSYLGNMSLVDEFFGNSVPFMVRVRLMKEPLSPDGLSWTSGKRAFLKIGEGTTITARIVNKTCTPLSLFMQHHSF
jgi:hypothetical protein